MAGINDITQGQYYKGDAALGGGYSPAIQLDTTPLDKLAAFTQQRDLVLYRQKQIDDATAADNLSEVTAYDITSPLQPQNEYLKQKYDEINKFLRENPNSLNFDKDREGYQKRMLLQNEFKTARKRATINDIIYNKRLNEVETEPDVQKKALMQAELDVDKERFFSQPDYWKNNTLNTAAEISAEDYKLPDLEVAVNEEIIQLPNSDIVEKVKFINPDELRTKADVVAFNLPQNALDKNSPEFLKLSESGKKLALAKEAYRLKNVSALRRMADVVSGIYGEIKTKNPEFQLSEESVNSLPIDGTAKDVLLAVSGYNSDILKLNALLPNAKSKDPTKKNVYGNFKPINIEDGIDASEILMLKMYQKQGGFVKSNEKDIKQNDNAIQRQQIYENARQFDREIALKWYNATKPPASAGSEKEVVANLTSFIEPVTRAATLAGGIPLPAAGKVNTIEVSDESIFKSLGLNGTASTGISSPDKITMEKDDKGVVTMKVYRNGGGKAEIINQSDFIRKVPANAGGLKVSDNNSQYYFAKFNELADRWNKPDWSFKYDEAFGTGASAPPTNQTAPATGGTNNWKSRASISN